MKKIFFVFIIIFAAGHVYAESVFLKNGTIFEGEIKKDTDIDVVINMEGKDRTILRKNILRVNYSDDYKKKKFIYLNNKTIIEAYIVEEKRNSYIYRKILNNANETTIQKDQVKFISKEKISMEQMQKKKKLRKLLSDRKNKFNNLMGVRLGVAYVRGDNKPDGMELDDNDGGLATTGFYYYDKYFEFDLNFAIGFEAEDRTMLHAYIFNLLPFNMFNVGIGIFIGYSSMSYNLDKGKEYGFNMHHEGIIIGLMYRHEGWFRFGLGYIRETGFNGYFIDMGSGYEMDQSKSDFNFYMFFEFYIWSNLSIHVSYYFTDSEYKYTGPIFSNNFKTHLLSIQASFGLNVF